MLARILGFESLLDIRHRERRCYQRGDIDCFAFQQINRIREAARCKSYRAYPIISIDDMQMEICRFAAFHIPLIVRSFAVT
jgi:hypothetical protein